eukprot:589273-Rhodomonas_salina.2
MVTVLVVLHGRAAGVAEHVEAWRHEVRCVQHQQHKRDEHAQQVRLGVGVHEHRRHAHPARRGAAAKYHVQCTAAAGRERSCETALCEFITHIRHQNHDSC